MNQQRIIHDTCPRCETGWLVQEEDGRDKHCLTCGHVVYYLVGVINPTADPDNGSESTTAMTFKGVFEFADTRGGRGGLFGQVKVAVIATVEPAYGAGGKEWSAKVEEVRNWIWATRTSGNYRSLVQRVRAWLYDLYGVTDREMAISGLKQAAIASKERNEIRLDDPIGYERAITESDRHWVRANLKRGISMKWIAAEISRHKGFSLTPSRLTAEIEGRITYPNAA